MQPYLLEFILAGLAILMLLAEAFVVPKGGKSLLALVGIGGLALIFILMNFVVDTSLAAPAWLNRFYIHDSSSIIYKNIAILSTIFVLLLSWDFRGILKKFTSKDGSDLNTGEFYALPLFACAGMMWMASAQDLVSVFVSLELVTITFYIMVAYMRRNVGSLEAGVKYLILGALSTGILVYGIAWLYGMSGTTQISEMHAILLETGTLSTPALFGVALLVIAISFKVGAVPMQLWIPDVYQGAPTPITAFLSVASKAAGFSIAIRVLGPFMAIDKVQMILFILAGATLLYGNLAALKQTNFKRLLAYSSIAHAGFILIALATGNNEDVTFYLVTYMLMTFGAFFILNQIRIHEGSDEIEAFNGFGKRNPTIAALFAVIMAAMAGLPLTVGFYGKFFVFNDMFSKGGLVVPGLLLVIAFISVAAGFYYYLKVIKAMYWHTPSTEERVPVSLTARFMTLFFFSAIVLFGFYPAPLIDLLR